MIRNEWRTNPTKARVTGLPCVADDRVVFRVYLHGTIDVYTTDGRTFFSKAGGASRQQRDRAEQAARDWAMRHGDTMEELLAALPRRSWWRRILNVA